MSLTSMSFVFLAFFFIAGPTLAGVKEQPGAQDHPLIGRYPGSALMQQGNVNFDEVDLPIDHYVRNKDGKYAPVKSQHAVGKVSNYIYWGPKDRSELEIFRNYQQILEKNGFSLLYVCDQVDACTNLGNYAEIWTTKRAGAIYPRGSSPVNVISGGSGQPLRYLAAKKTRAEGDVYVTVSVRVPADPQKNAGMGALYLLQVIEEQPMKTETIPVAVNASSLDKKSPQPAAVKGQPGAQDHPLIGRYPGSALMQQGNVNYEEVDLPIDRYVKDKNGKYAPARSQHAAGKVSNYIYWGPKDRSDLEVFRNYQQTLEKNDFSLLYVCDQADPCTNLGSYAEIWTSERANAIYPSGRVPINVIGSGSGWPLRYLVAKKARAEGDAYVSVTVRVPAEGQKNGGMGALYFLQVIEEVPMRTEDIRVIDASTLEQQLSAEGKVAIYGIQFDHDSAVIKPESKEQLEAMAKLLTQNAALKVFIVGHTDNVGEYSYNASLSKRRAEAVVTALAQQYKIPSTRLSAQGVANLVPVASNETETGRAMNRRVELVVQ